jgi:hypothetical protein
MFNALLPPTPEQIAKYKADRAVDDTYTIRRRIVPHPHTFERPDAPTRWGGDVEIGPGMASGTRRGRPRKSV